MVLWLIKVYVMKTEPEARKSYVLEILAPSLKGKVILHTDLKVWDSDQCLKLLEVATSPFRCKGMIQPLSL